MKIKKFIVSFCILAATGILFNSNKQAESPVDGKWELDVSKTYYSFTDTIEWLALTKDEKLKAHFYGVNPIVLAKDLFNSITIDRQIDKADLGVFMKIFQDKATLKFRNVDLEDGIFEYVFFGDQISIGNSRFNIEALTDDELILRAKSHSGDQDFPLFFKKVD